MLNTDYHASLANLTSNSSKKNKELIQEVPQFHD